MPDGDDVAGEGLRALVDQLHRPAGVQGQRAKVDMQVDILLAPECATDPGGGGHAPVPGVDRDCHHLFVVDVDVLAGGVQIDTALAIRDGEAGLGPQGCLICIPTWYSPSTTTDPR